MLGINFIGLSYLLVYVGAVSILFLFILMLINIRVSELITDSSNSIPLAIVIGVLFNVTLYELLPSNVSRVINIESINGNFVSGMGGKISYPLNNLFLDKNNDISFVTSQM